MTGPGDPTIAVVAGGVGAARLLRGVIAAYDPAGVTAIVNVADDEALHGLAISPDLDTVTYTCAGAIDPERGWGLAGETWEAMGTLGRYAAAAGRNDLTWFNLGDRDLGTHLFRTGRLAEGAPLSAVTAEIAAGWELGFTLLPVSDDRVATRLVTDRGELAFQEYFVRHQHGIAVSSVRFAGAEDASPAPGVLEAIGAATVVVIAPSNPIVSIGPVLAVPGVRDAVVARRADTVAVSPIVGGKALKGPADRLLVELGHESSVVGVARLYRDLASVLVIDEVDAALADAVRAEGIGCVVAPTIMVDREAAAALARTCVEALGSGAVSRLEVFGVEGIGEITRGADLAGIICDAVALEPHDVVVVTQKIVSKAEGAMVEVDPDDPLSHKPIVERESVRILRRRGDLIISETRHGFVCANAGIDLSNVDRGWAALLPEDPDRSARRIRHGIAGRTGVDVAVIVSDTFGRTWRRGVTDVAIGSAGLTPILDLRGTHDSYGRELQVTEVAIVDELTGAADLVMGKSTGVPVAVIRGVDPQWFGPGGVVSDVVRQPAEDLFR